ncbi:polysaccharide deacetylase family protein [bacterium]|nr:polysaccharide deacetylase family protein [bacterium]
MATLLIGYDVESGEPDVTRRFLELAWELHNRYLAPCSFFLVGRTLEIVGAEAFKPFVNNPLFDLQQHTYSHLLLKTVYIDDGEKIQLVRGGTLEEIERDVSKASRLLKDMLGIDCIGLTGPWGYYRGLCDRADILEILHKIGIRFTRTWARNEKDYQPTPFEVQPFWYEHSGFPDILECPCQGYQDIYWYWIYGEDMEGYKAYLRECADLVRERNWVWGYGAHDHTAIKDKNLSQIEFLIKYAQDIGIKIQTYKDFYEEMRSVWRS